MATYKEIVSKTVLGKGKKTFINTYDIITEQRPSTILGCWVINHKFKGYERNGKIIIDGSFDVNIWYSYDNDSKTGVVNRTIDYSEVVSIKLRNSIESDSDTNIIVRSLNGPSCNNINITNSDNINISITKELGIEVIGDAKIKILVEDDEEPWDLIEEDATEEEINDIDSKINDNFLK